VVFAITVVEPKRQSIMVNLPVGYHTIAYDFDS